ncbi:MAG: hypothetical protein WCD39_05605, partial [Methyloceanibacter sp.]
MHYISDSDAANRPQTRINKGSVLFAILQTVEDGFGIPGRDGHPATHGVADLGGEIPRQRDEPGT